MKLNKVALAVAFTAAVSSMSVLADTTNGQIQFQGELVNTACGLSPNSSPVSVDFGQILVSYTPTSVSPADATLAAFTSGTASNAGIGLKDSASQDVVWGQGTTAVQLVNGTNTIPFVAYVKADSADQTANPVTAGSFQSTINFQIAYQ